jgi:phage tail P2-like protein
MLVPPNWTQQEYEMARATERMSAVPVPIRELWNPETCPSALLPWLAWALVVDAWDSSWTDQQKRNAIIQSINIHRHKGTLGAVKAVFALLGVSAVIVEWWQQSPPGTPYTFNVIVAGTNAYTAVQDSIVNAINRVKPVRSEMFVSEVNGLLGTINAVGYVCATMFQRLEFAATLGSVQAVGLITDDGRPIVTEGGAQLVLY